VCIISATSGHPHKPMRNYETICSKCDYHEEKLLEKNNKNGNEIEIK
jgi:hypothetical protein